MCSYNGQKFTSGAGLMIDQSTLRRNASCLLLVCLMPFAGHAQTMYRCGATYQDRPCNGVDSKPVGSHVRQAAGQSSGGSTVDPACEARGLAAQRLMWEKESGRTLEEQLAKPGADASLARSVYGRRGSSLEVRRAIEVECVKELERAKDAAALLKAANKSQEAGGVGVPSGQPPMAAPANAGTRPAGGPALVDESASRRAAAKAATCGAIATEMSELSQALRVGGDAARMEVLSARMRDARSRKNVAGC